MDRPTKQATLCVICNEDEILLAMKKRGFGVGKYNGFGGKVNPGETIEEAVVRELEEESGLCAKVEDVQKVAELDFYFPYKPEGDQTVHVYLVRKYSGVPHETDEMAFEWFTRDTIPYDRMWDDDKYWLPLVLAGKKVEATFIFKEVQGESRVDYKDIKLKE